MMSLTAGSNMLTAAEVTHSKPVPGPKKVFPTQDTGSYDEMNS